MSEIKLGEMEAKFAEIIWKNENIPSGELVKLCEKELNWKKSTTYTMLRRLCEKGLFKNENGKVTALITKDELAAKKGEELIRESYGGSLPRFIASFAERKSLSKKELDEIQQMIDDYRKEISNDRAVSENTRYERHRYTNSRSSPRPAPCVEACPENILLYPLDSSFCKASHTIFPASPHLGTKSHNSRNDPNRALYIR